MINAYRANIIKYKFIIYITIIIYYFFSNKFYHILLSTKCRLSILILC